MLCFLLLLWYNPGKVVINMDTKEILLELRARRGFSQEQLAEKIGISVTHMSHIETGNTKLSLQVFVDITRALDISADDLLSESTPARRDQYADILAVLDTCGVQEVKILTDMVKSMKISLDKYT